MYREFTLRLKAVIAYIALEWLVLCMNSHVQLEFNICLEAVVADIASKRLVL
jgi:hypothetical protein